MTCGCKKNPEPGETSPMADCRFCTRTSVWWARHKSCYVWRCSNPAMLTDPSEWAYGNTRKATEGDSPNGKIIEGADWIAVRSCFCRCDRCKHYTEENHEN